MTHPESWLGLQKLFSWFLESVPLSLALMIPGLSIALFMAGTIMATMLFRFIQLRKRND
jgi:flagellar biosynthesis protein FliQ